MSVPRVHTFVVESPSRVATKGISANPGPHTRSVSTLTMTLPFRSTTTRKLPAEWAEICGIEV